MKLDSKQGPAEDSGVYDYQKEDISEVEWLSAAMKSESFRFLADPSEDIYTLEDGEPFHDDV